MNASNNDYWSRTMPCCHVWNVTCVATELALLQQGCRRMFGMENPGDAASTRTCTTCTNLDVKRSEGASGGGKDLSHRPSQVPSTMKTPYHRPSRRVPSTEWTPDPSTKQGATNEEDAIPIDQSGCHPQRGLHTIDQMQGASHGEDGIPSTGCLVPTTKRSPYHRPDAGCLQRRRHTTDRSRCHLRRGRHTPYHRPEFQGAFSVESAWPKAKCRKSRCHTVSSSRNLCFPKSTTSANAWLNCYRASEEGGSV